MKTTDNTILITGGASGIGLGLAESFYALGNKVIIAGRRAELLQTVAKEHPGMEWIQLDVSNSDDIKAVASKVIQRFPKLNVLINNAGVMRFDDLSMPIDERLLSEMVNTNLLGPIRITSALIEHLKKQHRATIVNNSSVVAFTPLAYNGIYSATKAAMHSYTMSLRFVLQDSSVTVQEIAPPWVNTDLIKKTDDPRAMDLDAFVAETMKALKSDEPEALVDAARPHRDNAGPGEYAFFNQLNEAIRQEPLPV
ncbi:SDR family oxidoreductase [Cerasicoccus frondis]|uniref:SDR family oxidoreductase n=1 Tax=Cerasicoccus frondis TaxID=490090 RepID=UPI0028529DC4|nr:SDR family NAD(P)-dependent oxidoreductase [Cerasicoccus frondis]